MKLNTPHSKTKILLFLPMIVLPFTALAFYALGGGKGDLVKGKASSGFNTRLPDAKFKSDDPLDKMGYYELSKNNDAEQEQQQDDALTQSGLSTSERADQQTMEITRKLASLQSELYKAEPEKQTTPLKKNDHSSMGADVDRLEALMKNMESSKQDDPELKQISSMLEKILDVQHPERLQNAYKQQSANQRDTLFAAIPAEVIGKQTLSHGSVMKLRLLDSAVLGGVKIPKGHLLFGICNLTNQRLLLDVKTLRIGNKIIPVDLSLYGPDGIKGVEAASAVISNTLTGSADDALRGMQFITTEQSMGMQLAGAGIDAAKNLFTKKIKRIKIKLAPNFHVLLRDNKPASK